MSQQCKYYHYCAWSWLYTLCIVLYFGWSEDLFWPVNTRLTLDIHFGFCALINFLPDHSVCANQARFWRGDCESKFWCGKFWVLWQWYSTFQYNIGYWLQWGIHSLSPKLKSDAMWVWYHRSEKFHSSQHELYFVSSLIWQHGGQATSGVITA